MQIFVFHDEFDSTLKKVFFMEKEHPNNLIFVDLKHIRETRPGY